MGQNSRRSKKDKLRNKAKLSKTNVADTVTDDDASELEQNAIAEEIVCDEAEAELSTNEANIDDSIDIESSVNIELPGTPEPQSNNDNSSGKNNTNSASKKALATSPSNSANATKKPLKRRRNSGTSSDEERWLTAIESGKLDDVDDELKKMKDPKLMTARQRAMYDRSQDKEPSPGGELLMALPSGYREKEKPQTAEDIQKAALKSQKRKQQADERREKDKKKTMDRLLKKQDSNKQRGAAARNKTQKQAVPMISYRNTQNGALINMPNGFDFPLQPQTAREPPPLQLCGIKDCQRPKVYNCSKTNVPLCSLECYRKNATTLH